MFDIWFELPPVLRAGLGILMILAAAVIWFATGGRLYAIGLAVVGLVFLLACNAGKDKGGYNF